MPVADPPRPPEYLQFCCPLTIEAAKGSPKTTPRFSMVAYTGEPMRIEGFPHPVVVDLEGLSIQRQDIPVRLDHHPRQGVGHTQKVAIVDGQVVAEGLVSRETSWARDVARSAGNGFPWQASIGAEVIEAEFVPHGQVVDVNGRTLEGPLHVVRHAILKEISFVDSGADAQTRVQVAAGAKENADMPNSDVSTTTTQHDEGQQAEPQTVAPQVETPTEVPVDTPTDSPVETPAEEATEPTAPPTVQATASPGGDPIVEWRKRLAAETRRVEAIRKLCDGKFPQIEAQAIEGGWSEVQTELAVLRASRPKVAAVSSAPRPAGRAVLEAAAMMAAGTATPRLEAAYDAATLDAAEKLRGLGVQEFCQMAAGVPLPRFRRDAGAWLSAAFSTASLPGILSNVANKLLLEGYSYIEDAWRKIAKIASVSDFKEHTRYRMTSNFRFLPVGPDGELRHGSLDEQSFSQKAGTHGILFALTRQMIINDDLAAFTEIPRQIGMGAAEAIAEAVWSLLLANPNSFFSVAHGNYAEGAETALSIDGLTAAEILFLDQTKPNGRPLGIAPSILLVPSALKVAAELLMSSLKVNETTTANKPKPSDNPHAGKYQVVTSAYLSSSALTGSSSKAWYLLADPNRLPAIEVAFLNGVDRPTVENADVDFATLGIQFRGYIDFGVREQDYRGATKFKGEA